MEIERSFSVIVPAYNTAAYIEQCISSVQRQTCGDWEIVIVDDGSTDGTGDICKRLARKDSRIRCLSMDHAGAAAARNVGIECSRGEYLFFLDSDDTIHPQLFEQMHRQIQLHHPELLTCGFVSVHDHEQRGGIRSDVAAPQWQVVGPDQSHAFFHDEFRLMQGTPSKTVRRDFLAGYRFDETLAAVEDGWFFYELACRGIKIVYTRSKLYYYMMRPDSITHCMDMDSSISTITVRKRICQNESRLGNASWENQWERIMLQEMKRMFSIARQQNDPAWQRYLKGEYIRALRCRYLREGSLHKRLAYSTFFLAHPLYQCLRGAYRTVRGRETPGRGG